MVVCEPHKVNFSAMTVKLFAEKIVKQYGLHCYTAFNNENIIAIVDAQ